MSTEAIREVRLQKSQPITAAVLFGIVRYVGNSITYSNEKGVVNSSRWGTENIPEQQKSKWQ